MRKILDFFFGKGPPFSENRVKIFSHPDIAFIHPSIVLVEFSRNLLFLNFFEVKSAQNNSKNSVKIRLFIGRFKKIVFLTLNQ